MSPEQEEKPRLGRVEEARRLLIIDAAAECVAEEGVELLTLRKVAKRAGVSIGMITYYFATKNELMIATLQRSSERISHRWPGERGPAAGIERMRNVLKTSLTEPPEAGANWPFRLAYAAKAASEPELRGYYVQQTSNIRAAMLRDLERAALDGEVDSSYEHALMANLLLALYQGLGMAVTLDPEQVPPDRALEILDFVLRLLAPQR